MIKQYFLQALSQLRQQPLISLVTVAGTALSILLIMLVVMIQQVQVEPFAPESNRDRMLHVKWQSLSNEEWGDGTSNGPWSASSLREVYGGLTTAEAVTIYSVWTAPMPVSLPGQPARSVDARTTDADFWHVFDFAFVDGKPFSEADVRSGLPVAVVTESVARALFGTVQAAGREFLLAHAPFRVAGVVKDVSTLASTAYSQLWAPYTAMDEDGNTWNDGLAGMMSCTILARSRADFPAIREECNRRLAAFNTTIAGQGWKIVDRNRPYDQEKNALSFGANYEPDVRLARRQRWVTFAILLLVPAINLSSMTQSRLRQRVSEIGVRRAFGCTRAELIGQLLWENLIVTLLAGVLGLLLSLAFAYGGSHLLFAQEYSQTLNPPAVDASILIHASTFGWALLFCFVLNLLSTGIPAWRAARMNVVEAIGGRLH